jgi:general secretion pathway protein L
LSTLYIRLPSKTAAEGVEHWLTLPCAFASVSTGVAIEREGVASLAELAAAVAAAQRVVLLVAASDVTLLRIKTPPLSAAKLRQALPHLVEDQLMTDAAECVVVAGELADGLRTAATVQRAWLDILAQTFSSFGARSLVALPAQLCLPYQAGRVTAAFTECGADLDIALRLTEQGGIGLPIMPEAAQTAAAEVLAAVRAVAPVMPVTLYVPQARVAEYQEALRSGVADVPAPQEISVFADNWSNWLQAADKASLNLMSGMAGGAGAQMQWRPWRWPIALAAAILLINAIGLNIDWWRLKREATALRTGMIQLYKSAYPNETVILDALAQMHKKVAEAERNAGQVQADDFGQIAANFAEALAAQEPGKGAAAIALLEYHERSLLVHLKPGSNLSSDKMAAALTARNLSLSSPSNGVWQIKGAK